MPTPFQQSQLERMVKRPCSNEGDSGRNWQDLYGILTSILSAPFLYHNENRTGDEILAFDEVNETQLVPGGMKWAVADGAILQHPAAGNQWIGIIRGLPCADFRGAHKDVHPQVFIIRGKEGQSYSIDDGSVFGYQFDSQGKRIATLDPIAPVTAGDNITIINNEVNATTIYGKAQHNWEKNSGTYRIEVKNVESYAGAVTGDAFYVYFRGGADKQKPNVRLGQVITYTTDQDGVKVTTDGWDSNFGDVVFRAFATSYTAGDGWSPQDGTNNTTTGSVGSGRDWTTNDGTPPATPSEWPPIYLVPGAPGTNALASAASLAHSHTAFSSPSGTGVKVYDPDNSGDLSSSYPAHRDHVHYGGPHCGTCDFATDPMGVNGYLLTGFADDHNSDRKWWTGGAQAKEGTHTADHADITLRHAVYDPGHGHSVSLLPTYQTVHYKQLLPYERIDNSFEVTGI